MLAAGGLFDQVTPISSQRPEMASGQMAYRSAPGASIWYNSRRACETAASAGNAARSNQTSVWWL